MAISVAGIGIGISLIADKPQRLAVKTQTKQEQRKTIDIKTNNNI